jgi:hypothetical protein
MHATRRRCNIFWETTQADAWGFQQEGPFRQSLNGSFNSKTSAGVSGLIGSSQEAVSRVANGSISSKGVIWPVDPAASPRAASSLLPSPTG